MPARRFLLPLLLLAGCSGTPASQCEGQLCAGLTRIPLAVTRPACDTAQPAPEPTHLRLRVIAVDDGSRLEDRVVEVASWDGTLGELPQGRKVRVEASGFQGAPSATNLAQSHGTFTLQAGQAPTAEGLTVALRPVETFLPVGPASGGACTTLSTPRAAHAATLLPDGRVLLTGGFEGKTPATLDWNFKSTVEIFDPASGAITSDTPPMQLARRETPRGFHTATRLNNGQVLVAGGETNHLSQATNVKSMLPVGSALLFDPSANQGKGAWTSHNLSRARSRHTATLHRSGKVLFVGGVVWSVSQPPRHEPVQRFEWFDPERNAFLEASSAVADFPRVGHAALAVMDGEFVAVAGGHDGTTTVDQGGVRFFQHLTLPSGFSYFAPGKQSLDLSPGRTGASAALVGDSQFVLLGGFQSNNLATPYSGSDVVRVKEQLVRSVGPVTNQPFGDACSVTLRDRRALTLGGRGLAAGGGQQSLAISTVLTEVQPGQVKQDPGPSLAEPRYHHSCTVLEDGSVLVAGGVVEKGGAFATTSSLELFVPRPQD